MKQNKLSLYFSTKNKKERISWLLPAEVSMVIYALFTLAFILVSYTLQPSAETLIWWRVRMVALTIALWFVYRLWPCRAMEGARIVLLLATLGSWYPDTYELNCHLPNLDHVFAAWDQSLFGFQPSLLWSQAYPSPVISELMKMGYGLYFLMFVSIIFITFFTKYKDFQRVSFIIIASFFVYYIIFDLLPVSGPQYYYQAVGIENIAAGHFPELPHGYFANHLDCLAIPGWEDGLFHHLVQASHNAGERPTAAFPSSHVSMSTISMLVAIQQKRWRYLIIFAVPYIFLVMGTVYIYAHYAVDAIAGFLTAFPVFFLMEYLYKKYFSR